MNGKVFIAANSSGGLYKFRNELIQKIIEMKYDVVASTPFDSNLKELETIGTSLVDTPINRRGINPFLDMLLIIKYFKMLRKYKPELVITYTIKPNIYCGIACSMLRIPYATNITGLGTAFQKKSFLRNIAIFLYKIGLKKAKVVFFENSENLNIFIDEKIVPKNKCVLLSGAGVNLERFSYLEYPTESNITKFLFIGRVMKEKGIDELFQAMKKLVSNGVACQLDIIGGFEEDYEIVIKEYEQEGWLHYYGFQDDVRTFIKNSHCFVLPSWHEGMANTNLECAACGRPIITSDIHGCLEAVIDGVSGFLCKSKNYESLYHAMKHMTELSNEQRIKMGKAGRNHMEEIFDKNKVVNETVTRLF